MGWDQWRRGHCHHPLRPSDLQVLPAAGVVFLKCRLHLAAGLHLQDKSELQACLLPTSQSFQNTTPCYCMPALGMFLPISSFGKLGFQNPAGIVTSSMSPLCPRVGFSGLGTPGLWPHLTGSTCIICDGWFLTVSPTSPRVPEKQGLSFGCVSLTPT